MRKDAIDELKKEVERLSEAVEQLLNAIRGLWPLAPPAYPVYIPTPGYPPYPTTGWTW